MNELPPWAWLLLAVTLSVATNVTILGAVWWVLWRAPALTVVHKVEHTGLNSLGVAAVGAWFEEARNLSPKTPGEFREPVHAEAELDASIEDAIATGAEYLREAYAGSGEAITETELRREAEAMVRDFAGQNPFGG